MSLIINHNLMALNTARTLNNTYDQLSGSVKKLSSGLRVNSAADDAAGLAIRELMRSDIQTMRQGIRNAVDAISLIQTAEGAMSVIDEKLTRMKELAEQAATGTYTTSQREMINSEYQAMAAEIDRIAAAANFNGVKLLDGSFSNLHGGKGMKIHFGVGNNQAEDYYFLTMEDARATSSTGLKIGGDAKNDVWGQGAAGTLANAGPGCCATGFHSLDKAAGFASGASFIYGYNWDWEEDDDSDLLTGKYLAGRYAVGSSESLQDLIRKVNAGTQSRVGVRLDSQALAEAIKNGGNAAVCVGDEAYLFGRADAAGGTTVEGPHEGVAYERLAQGSFLGDGFLANREFGSKGYGFGLGRAQMLALEKAGADLSSLGLKPVTATETGRSLISSAGAENDLLRRLESAWKALGLEGLSAIQCLSGVSTGFSIPERFFTADARRGENVSGSGMNAVILADETLQIRAGVYADQQGNWTDDRRVAEALDLSEVVFAVGNRNTPLLETALAAPYRSSLYAALNSSILYQGDLATLEQAGITLFSSAGFAELLSARGETASEASAALLAKTREAFRKAYANVGSLLTLSAANGLSMNAGKTVLEMEASAAAQGTSFLPGGALANDQTLVVSANVWVDLNGNFTTDQKTASALGLQRMVYTLHADSLGNFDAVELNGASLLTTGDPLDGALNPGDSLSVIASLINQSVAWQINDRQSGSGATGQGRLSLASTDITQIWLPTAPELDGQKVPPHAVPLQGDLSVSVTLAGDTSPLTAAFGKALTGLDRKTATIGDVAARLPAALKEILESLHKESLASGFEGTGRLVAGPPEVPPAPVSISGVDALTVSSEFHAGELEKSVASGTYADQGHLYNAETGYGLSSAREKLLRAAGLDLLKLGLRPAAVSGSAASSESSAAAKAALTAKLQKLWLDLSLGSLSAVNVEAYETTGYRALTSAEIKIAAAAGAVGNSAALGGSYLLEQKTVTVMTGIYADLNGNWTEDEKLAADLGLSEISFTVENNNYAWNTLSADWKSGDYFQSGGLLASSSFIDAILAASGSPALAARVATLAGCSIRAVGSGANETEASASLLYDAQRLWREKYENQFSSLTFERGNDGRDIKNPAYAFISQSADSTNTESPGGPLIDGASLKVHTGIYIDGNGNWTDEKEAADFLGMTEAVFQLARAGNVCTLTGPDSLTDTLGLVNITEINVQERLMDFIELLQGSVGTGLQGKISLSTQSGPAAPGKDDLDGVKSAFAKHAVNLKDPSQTGFLDVRANIGGEGRQVFDLWNPPRLPADGNLTEIAAKLGEEISLSLKVLQNSAAAAGFVGQGRVYREASQPPAPPADEGDLTFHQTRDYYHEAAGENTVSRKGFVDRYKLLTVVATSSTPHQNASGYSNFGARALASAINHNKNSQFWAMTQAFDSHGDPADMVYIFTKDGGDFNDLLACEVSDGSAVSREALSALSFENAETGKYGLSGANFSLGGQDWGKFLAVQSKAKQGYETWNLTLNGRDTGKERDLWIAAEDDLKSAVVSPGLKEGLIHGLDRLSFTEIQNADDAPWRGAEVRTQSSAQQALTALNDAIARKDKARAGLGAFQNRLENTVANLEIQMEALAQSESRISDADMATEMTEFVKNQVLSRAAVSMLSQANSLPQMALSLLNG
jgi:flagellin-like hook-associated protein FlgL